MQHRRRFLAYTCVFGGYDRVFPPVFRDSQFDYVLVTDDASTRVEGWKSMLVDISAFSGPKAANRYFKMLGHRQLGDYEASIYVDGNIRILGVLQPLLQSFLDSTAALGVYPHPRRKTVGEEAVACISSGKSPSFEDVTEELARYREDGFPADERLIEATILLKNHEHPMLDPAMSLWWNLFSRFENRDQFSLPYVLWKTGLPHQMQKTSFREANPYFGIYPHFAANNVPAGYAYCCARAFDSTPHKWARNAWEAKWVIQRCLQRQRPLSPRRDPDTSS